MNQEQHSESEPYQPDTSGDETLSEDSNKKKRIAGKSPRPFIIPDETDSEDDLQKPVHYEKKWIKKKFMVTEGLRPVPHAYDEDYDLQELVCRFSSCFLFWMLLIFFLEIDSRIF